MEKFKAVSRETHMLFDWLNQKFPKKAFNGL